MHGIRSARLTTYSELNRNHRQRSTSQSNLNETADRRQTYGGLRRSSSVTNIRTPHRTQVSRSPGNRTPSTSGLTSSSEQYRRQATENTNKVMDVIQSNRSFFNRLNFGNSGLKSMTSNQFIELISFFMMKIAGKNFLSKSRPNNHENVIMTFIQSLNYPFTVNKACFKTPNAHQYFPEVIAILAFLSDLVRDIKKYATPADMPLIDCKRLINDAFTQLFSAEILRNYLNYDPDSGHLLDNEGEAKLVNGLIAIKMKNDGLTADELAKKAKQLEQLSEQLQQNLIETESEKYFSTIVEQFIEKEKELTNLQENLTERRKYLKMIMLTHDERAAKLTAKQGIVRDLMDKIQQQNYTILDIKQLMAKETSVKNSIEMIQNERDAIKIEAADAQVKLARLHKLKLDMIKKFNDFTFRITQKLVQTIPLDCLNVNDFTIDPIASAQHIQIVCQRLTKLNERLQAVKQQHSEQIQQNNHKLAEIKAEFNQLTEKHTELLEIFQKANQKFNTMNTMRSSYETNGSSNQIKLQREIAEKIINKQQLHEQISELKIKAKELQANNIQMFEDGEKQAREIIRAKQATCNQMDELNDFIDDLANKIEE